MVIVAVVTVLAAVLGGLVVGRFVWPRFSEAGLRDKLLIAEHERDGMAHELASYEAVADALKSDRDLWSLRASRPPEGFSEWSRAPQPPVLLVGNLKGGVGKTTLAANLAAYFDSALSKRVLLIDLDFQGSLSAMVARGARVLDVESQVDAVLSGERMGGYLCDDPVRLPAPMSNTRLLTAQYPLASVENRLMIEWAFQTDTESDSRFNLARALMDARVANTYHLVIIDAPPRLSFAMVNALAAASHVLAPTTLDGLSAEATGNFLVALSQLRRDLNPHIRLSGVVGTMSPTLELGAPQLEAVARLRRDAQEVWGPDARVLDAHLPRRQTIAAAAGAEVAYTRLGPEGRAVRALIDPIGAEVAQTLGWRPPTPTSPDGVLEEESV